MTLLSKLSLFGVLCSHLAIAQSFRISGTVRNPYNESLPFAHVTVKPEGIIFTTDSTGEFSLRVAGGDKILGVSFIGYESIDISLTLTGDTVLRLVLYEALHELAVVEVDGLRDSHGEIFDSNRASTNLLDNDDITSIPVLGGEADAIKALQLLPGTVKGLEGSSDLFVRGGAADQNLVLLDGAPVYNTSHLFGFLSVFNTDILDHVESINGGFPAQYGGRLSSILNVDTKSSTAEKTYLSGDVGLIASRLMIEQPIIKEKASIWFAGRRTYIDKMAAMAGYEIPYFFYDLNGKLNVKLNEREQLSISHYDGKDMLDWFRDRNNDGDGYRSTYRSGNDIQSLNWKRDAVSGWQSEVSLIRSAYRYDITYAFEDNGIMASSRIQDYTVRLLLKRDSIKGNTSLVTGSEWTRHTISPSMVNATGLMSELFESNSSRGRVADEFAAHTEYTMTPASTLRLTFGMRASAGVVGNKIYLNPEPRISARWSLPSDQAIKLSVTRMVQYVHRISNSAASTPVDIWYPITEKIRPQTSDQLGVAWQKVIPKHKVFFSAEAYYKSMSDLIGFEEGTNLFFNADFANRLIQGKGRAYGFEFLTRKETGKLTGWISYTLAWSWRKYDDINNGQWFHSRYDRRHNGAVVLQYALSKRWSTSLVWEYISGSRFTPIVGQYLMIAPTLAGADFVPLYSNINGIKLADTHRLDLGIRFKSKPGQKFQWHWFAGVYNVYNRATPMGIDITEDKRTGALRYEQPGLFGLLPFISYGFSL